MRKMAILVPLVMMLVASVVLGQDKVDNPTYKAWSGFKVGTTVKTVTTDSETGGDKAWTLKMTKTLTLTELSADKAVVEVGFETGISGANTQPSEKGRMEIPAKMTKRADTQPADLKATKNEGDEEIAVGDKKYKCHWVETRFASGQMEGTLKVWTCSDVPGGMARTVKTAIDTAKSRKRTTTMEVVEFKAAS
jgi:hypothetical protein